NEDGPSNLKDFVSWLNGTERVATCEFCSLIEAPQKTQPLFIPVMIHKILEYIEIGSSVDPEKKRCEKVAYEMEENWHLNNCAGDELQSEGSESDEEEQKREADSCN